MNSSQRILCVLQDQDDINLFTYFFANRGFAVQGVCTVEEGLQVCLTDPPDLLIILRLIREPEDGLRLCQQLREPSTGLSTLPIIMGWADIFPHSQNQDWGVAYQQAFDAGANACFGRVFDITDILEQVELLMADRTLTHLIDRQRRNWKN
jgi:CheY-like chemotaxis protein